MDFDLGTIDKFSKRDFLRITSFPQDSHIGTHEVTATIIDKLFNTSIGQAFKFLVQVVPSTPIKPPDFVCPLRRKAWCLPRIAEVTPKGVMLVKFPLGLSSFNET